MSRENHNEEYRRRKQVDKLSGNKYLYGKGLIGFIGFDLKQKNHHKH